MKIKKVGGDWLWVDFRYTFCFICGCLGHTERKCIKLYNHHDVKVPKPYGPWLKAANQKGTRSSGEKWFQLAMTAGKHGGDPIGKGEGMEIDKVTVTNVESSVYQISSHKQGHG